MRDDDLQKAREILQDGFSPMLFLNEYEKEAVKKQLSEMRFNCLTVSTEKENRDEDRIFDLSFADKYNSKIRLTSDLSIYNEPLENAIINAMNTTCADLTRKLCDLLLKSAIDYMLLEKEKINYNSVLRMIDNLCDSNKRSVFGNGPDGDFIANELVLFNDSLLNEAHDTLVPYLEELSNYEYLPLRKLDLNYLENKPTEILIIKSDFGNNYICDVIRRFIKNNEIAKQNIVVIGRYS